MTGTETAWNELILASWLRDLDTLASLAHTGSFLRPARNSFPPGIKSDEVIRLAEKSHAPETYDEWLLAHAARLGAGEPGKKPAPGTAFSDKALPHVASVLHLDERAPSKPAWCALHPLDDHAAAPVSTNPAINKQEFERLWRGFAADFPALKGLAPRDFNTALDTLMERYFWCLPSLSGRGASFFRQAKLTAAFAGVLYRYHKTTSTETIEKLADDTEQKFLLVNGDMSGIQKYIFDLKVPTENAKLLRARSFQLWALSEIIAENLSARGGVSRECVITSAGGKFLLLLPHTQETKTRLEEARLELERYFLNEFGGKLCFILSEGTPASGDDFRGGRVRGLLNKIGYDAEWAKQRKMQAVLSEDGPALEKLYENLQRNGECAYCGNRPNENAGKGKEQNLCGNCADLVDIGGRLLHSSGDKIVLKTETIGPFGEMIRITGKDDPAFGYTINEYSPGSPLMLLPYTAPVKNEHELLTFEDMADLSTGNKKLAMFKADVDNLGLIFTSSLGDTLSLSSYAELSRRLHCFFSGYLAAFIRNNADYRQKIYTVFSGGDDVCVIGAWDAVMRFAPALRDALKNWTNSNPSVTLSGGLALASLGLPVRSIAEEAETALEAAKKRVGQAGRIIKDGVSVFGVTAGWEDYAKSLADAKMMLQHIADGKVSSAVIYKMIDFANRAKRVNNGSLQPRDLLWMSNYRYVMARNIKGEHKDAVEFFHQFGNSPDLMEKSRIAVSYTLYANRKDKEESDA